MHACVRQLLCYAMLCYAIEKKYRHDDYLNYRSIAIHHSIAKAFHACEHHDTSIPSFLHPSNHPSITHPSTPAPSSILNPLYRNPVEHKARLVHPSQIYRSSSIDPIIAATAAITTTSPPTNDLPAAAPANVGANAPVLLGAMPVPVPVAAGVVALVAVVLIVVVVLERG